MTLVWSVIRLTLGAGLVALAYDWRTPTFANIREWILIGLIIAPLCLAAVEFSILRRPVSRSMKRACTIASLALAALALGWTLALQADFLWIRRAVLTADTGLIEQLGRHIIVGYRNGAELKNLIDRRAIAGVYITSRNIKDRSADDIRRDIAAWQATRQRQGLPPLWITADQEGGLVSRLSPPLRRRMSLSQFAADSDRAAREAATKTYAANQAQELRDLGVNLNLAPVVDVNHGVAVQNDRYSLISRRAISDDPQVVSEVAATYCATLKANGVICTLKHFPGLGRINRDTHLEGADLDVAPAILASTDWMPFRTIMRDADAFVMLGHVRLTALDRGHPVSFSRVVVDGLLRRNWRFDGVLITDDFSMGAVYQSGIGFADASVEALNAGVDLILVSFDTDQYYAIMNRLLQASHSGKLEPAMLAASDRRLAHAAAARK